MRPEYGSDNSDQTWLNVTRTGTVYARRNGRRGPEVKVFYIDRDTISDWLPVGQKGAAGAAFHYCPRVGDNVTVLHLSTGIEQGMVLCSNGTANNPSFIPNSLDSVAMATDDGAFFEHEPNSGTMTMAGVETLHLHINGDTLAFSGGKWTLNVGGDLTASVGGSLNATVTGNATLKSPQITLDGNTTITGNLTVGGSINIAQGKGGTQMTISGDITHQGSMNTTGTHTDSRGHHS